MKDTAKAAAGREHEHRVIIVGTGFAGIGMAIRLQQAGIRDFVMLERSDRLGGTWRDNDYPGAACDVQSHLYSYSFAPNPDWSRMFAPQGEILAYTLDCVARYGLEPHIVYNRNVVRADFDESTALWTVETEDGSRYRGQALVSGAGGLSRPSYPDIPGLETFRGRMFHTAQWDHGYALAGKRVAVVGTGASAIQVVPAIVDEVGHLTLFQRTAPWVLPKPDREIGPRERALYRRFPVLQQLQRNRIYWSLEARVLGFVYDPRIMKGAELLARGFLRHAVKDAELRRKVTPTYTIGCKRILMSNEYYPALQRENCAVVTDSIVAVEPTGVRTADGVLHEVDCIIMATGFQAAEAAAPFPITGLGGVDINDAWADGAEAYKGTMVAGFPNLFMIVGPNTGLGHSSMIFMIEAQVEYALAALRELFASGAGYIDVRREVQDAYNEQLQERLGRAVWATDCNSWYKTASGRNTTLWPGFTWDFRRRLLDFRPDEHRLVAVGVAAAAHRTVTAAAPGTAA